jgi:hypothetical protein
MPAWIEQTRGWNGHRQNRGTYATCVETVAHHLAERHREEAATLFREASGVTRGIVKDFPTASYNRHRHAVFLLAEARHLVRCAETLGDTTAIQAARQAALTLLAEAVFHQRVVVMDTEQRVYDPADFLRRDPYLDIYRELLVETLTEKARWLLRQQSLLDSDRFKAEAGAALVDAIEICRQLIADRAGDAKYESRLADLLKLQAERFASGDES